MKSLVNLLKWPDVAQAAVALAMVLTAGLLVSQEKPPVRVGPLEDGGFLLNSGWVLRPAGEQVPVDTLPMRSALSKDGRYLLVLNAGYKEPSISVIEVATKKEMKRVPLASLMLRRLGSAFVDRVDRHKGASDARRVVKLAAAGQSLVFFPEGTFDANRRIGRFLGGAFTTAKRAQMPIVAAAIHGTREVLPDTSLLIRRRPIRFEILGVVDVEGARQRSRELIAQALGEPLAR